MLLSSGIVSPVKGLPSTLAPEGEQGQTKRPNILLLFPDQHRFDWLGTNPHLPVRTPNLDKLGQRGVRFTHVLTPSPLCAPARACLASGKAYTRCGVPSNGVDYPLDEPTFYSMLRASGYWVAGCGKLDLNKPDRNTGVDGKYHLKEWGFSDGINCLGKGDAVSSGRTAPHDPYMAYLYRKHLAKLYIQDMEKRAGGTNPGGGSGRTYGSTWPSPLPEDAYCDNWIGRCGLELMRRSPKGKPWFLMVNFAGPHNPEDVTRDMWNRWKGVNFPPPNGADGYSQEINNAIRRNYSAMVENLDRWVGIYLQELEKRGELENTLVVYSSDHGEMLGDHNHWAKQVPYQPSVSVPLILSGPGVQRGVVSDALVSTMDLAATSLDYAGVPRPADMDSRSLRPVLEGATQTHREVLSSRLGPWSLSFDGRYKLIRGFDPDGKSIWQNRRDEHRFLKPADGPLLLFDLETDPGENLNLAQKPGSEGRKLSSVFHDEMNANLGSDT